MTDTTDYITGTPGHHYCLLEADTIARLTDAVIRQYAPLGFYADPDLCRHIFAVELALNQGLFTGTSAMQPFPEVGVQQAGGRIQLSCSCGSDAPYLCTHEALVLAALIRRDELAVFFNTAIRQRKLQQEAIGYGLEREPDLDLFFDIAWVQQKVQVSPKIPSLAKITVASLAAMADMIYGAGSTPQLPGKGLQRKTCVVLRQHKYYKYLVVELYQYTPTKEGKPKNPLTLVNPAELIWPSEDMPFLKFCTAVGQFQQYTDGKRSAGDITALKAIIRNPAAFTMYRHTAGVSEQVTASALQSVQVRSLPHGALRVSVRLSDNFYALRAELTLNGCLYQLADMTLCFSYFLDVAGSLYLVEQPELLGLIELLKQQQDQLLVHAARYPTFKQRLLDQLSDRIIIDYQYIRPATAAQLAEEGFGGPTERILYLSDSDNQVLLTPVIRYHDVEIPIRSQRQIYATDSRGHEFLVGRDDSAEVDFTALLIRQHESFAAQLENDLPYFYLHRKTFLEEDWFLNVFDEWRSHGIIILGFNELADNRLSPYKATIDIKVRSGINWFNVLARVQFGKKKASLNNLHKAIRNRSRYVALDDGTWGILPADWIEKFAAYFNAGDITGEETLQIPHINYTAVARLYDEALLDESAVTALRHYQERIDGFNGIQPVAIPDGLLATLRPYQHEGLNWLNFLDDLNFGGCLADDMGLGKSIQIIAFILLQREKVPHNTNLLVVPATLIFNWQAEIARFAPSIQVLTVYGPDRVKHSRNFDSYELVLTSYGTLLSDIGFLSRYTFNYVFLDESQLIKNPETQRYKAVRLLQSRNKIVITGTPVENNSFDLFSQLSFACPGLLGNKQYFKDIYATPVDVFKNSKRAIELQQKVQPFILRRTKDQVAPDLPEKTEMILYCAMGAQQRKVYDAYEKEFRDYISAADGDELKKNAMNVLKGLTRLRQICNAPVLLGLSSAVHEESAKMDLLLAQIEEKSTAHKILVFSQFVGMLRLVAQQLEARSVGFTMLTGSTRNREAVVRDFQENADCRVFLVSLKAGGTGLNLTAADYVYLVDPWWNPAVEDQAIDRAHRIGQDKKVIAVRLICQDTVEEKILKMQEEKKALSRNLVQTDTRILQTMDKNYLLQLLAPPQ